MPEEKKISSSDVIIQLAVNLFLEALEHGPEIINAINESSLENKEEWINRIRVAQNRLDEWL